MTGLSSTLLWVLLLAPGAADVTAVTSDSAIRLVRGSGSVKVIYRNTSELTLSNARLEVKPSQPVELRARPARIPRCQPADRCVFVIDAVAKPDTPEKLFPATLTLVADGRPRLHRSRLHVDATPGAADAERGWMWAGSVRVGKGSQTMHVLMLVVLGVVPVVLLLGLGTYFKRKARRTST